jgi:hypothetical protein
VFGGSDPGLCSTEYRYASILAKDNSGISKWRGFNRVSAKKMLELTVAWLYINDDWKVAKQNLAYSTTQTLRIQIQISPFGRSPKESLMRQTAFCVAIWASFMTDSDIPTPGFNL